MKEEEEEEEEEEEAEAAARKQPSPLGTCVRAAAPSERAPMAMRTLCACGVTERQRRDFGLESECAGARACSMCRVARQLGRCICSCAAM